MTTTSDDGVLERAVAVAVDLHRATLDSKLLDRRERWDIFATRLQSAAESSDTLAAFCEAFARKLDVGSLYGVTLGEALRTRDDAVVRAFRDESIAVTALVRVALAEARARRDGELALFPETEVTR